MFWPEIKKIYGCGSSGSGTIDPKFDDIGDGN